MPREDLTVEQAASRLGTTARALRHRERLGLLPPVRSGAGAHRRYSDRALHAASRAAALEARYGVPPAALAFALRAVVDPALADELRGLARSTGRDPSPAGVLSFEQEKAQRLLRGRASGGAAAR